MSTHLHVLGQNKKTSIHNKKNYVHHCKAQFYHIIDGFKTVKAC